FPCEGGDGNFLKPPMNADERLFHLSSSAFIGVHRRFQLRSDVRFVKKKGTEMKLAEMAWPDVAGLDKGRGVVVAPYAACEQHSRHLPFFTDTLLVSAVAEGVEGKSPDGVLLLPTQWMGASAHHLPFLGTLTADLETHVRMMID